MFPLGLKFSVQRINFETLGELPDGICLDKYFSGIIP
jgi:hypothetical protein